MRKTTLLLGILSMIAIVSCKDKEGNTVPAAQTETSSKVTTNKKTTTVTTKAEDIIAIKISTEGVNVTTKDGKTKTSINVSGGEAKVEIKK